MEHRLRVAAAYKLIHFGIVVAELDKIDFLAARLLDVVGRFFYVGESCKTEEVHFEQAQLLVHNHVVLRYNDVFVCARQRNVLGYRVAADDNARRVHAYLTRHALYLFRHVQHAPRGLVVVVQLNHFGHAGNRLALFVHASAEQIFDVHFFGAARNHFCYVVYFGERQVEHAPDVFNSRLGRHGAERRNLRNVAFAVFFGNVVYDFAPAIDAKVNIEVGVAYALGVKKPLENKRVFKRVYLGYADSVSDNTARATTSTQPDGYALTLGVMNKIPYDKEVIYKPQPLDNA